VPGLETFDLYSIFTFPLPPPDEATKKRKEERKGTTEQKMNPQ
jgi:hypothetical protein